jgi:lipopolysaccharide cholinephosphotransferase
MQQKLLEMLICVDKLFKKNNIHYCLIGGSVLGSIRHKGFIPWDDDIDIGILRKDFTKAEELLLKLNNYIYEPVENHIIRNAPIGQLHYIDDYYTIVNSPTIDCFPLDRVPNNKLLRKLQFFFVNVYHLCLYRQKSKNRGFFMNFLSGAIIFLSPNKLLDFYQNIAFKIITHWEGNISYDLANIFGDKGYKEIFDKRMFEELRLEIFEGLLFPIPSNPDIYLTALYGNYMELPPLEERQSKHHIF